jgi:hypothetical protein
MDGIAHIYIRNIELHKKTGASLDGIKHIRSETSRCFGSLINQSNNTKASLVYDKRYVDDVNKLAEIFIKHSHMKRLPELFTGAIKVNNQYAAAKLADPGLPYSYELDLKTLIEKSFPDRSRKNENGANADSFLMSFKHNEKTGNFDEALDILRRMGVIKRLYDSPISSFIPGTCLSQCLTDIQSMSFVYFKQLFDIASEFNVRLIFHGDPMQDHHALANEISVHHLSGDGRTLRLFQISILAAIFKSTEGSAELVLDLGRLTPERLKGKENKKNNKKDDRIGKDVDENHNREISDKEVEDIIDRRGNYEKNENIVLFLKQRGALKI